MSAKIKYLVTGSWPARVGITTSKKAFEKATKKLAGKRKVISKRPMAVTYAYTSNKSGLTIIVLRNSRFASRLGMIETCAHEATHVADFIFDAMDETEPGWETQAYLIGWLTRSIYKEFRRGN